MRLRSFFIAASSSFLLLDLVSSIPLETRVQPPNWVDCPPSLSTKLKCLTVPVPLDYNNPKGETINLTVVKLITNGTQKLGSAVFQWGGPGDPSASVLATEANGTTSSFGPIKDSFDILAIDPRGIGVNYPVKCDPTFGARDLSSALYPDNETDFNNAVQLFKSLAQSCVNRTGNIINYMDTLTSAKDLESVRVAIGEGKLTYFGQSWGTVRGQQYAQLYPQNIRAMALDGVVDHTIDPFRQMILQTVGFTNNQHRFLDWASTNETSPLKGQDARQILKNIIKQADSNPITVPICVQTKLCLPQVTGKSIRAVLETYLDKPFPGYMQYATAIQQASQGNWTLFGTMNGVNNDEWGTQYSELAITCQDYDYHESWESYQQAQIATAAWSLDLEGSVAGRLGAIACKGWPTKVTNPPKDYYINSTSAPILLSHSFWDDSAAYPFAVSINRKINGSVLLTRAGEGHGSLNWELTRDAIYNYMIDPVKNLPKPLTVIVEQVVHNETDGFTNRNLQTN